jgi:hypothetical protein
MFDGLVYEGHRTVIGRHPRQQGRGEVVAGMQIAAEEGADRFLLTPIAVRADHLALTEGSFHSSADADGYFSSVALAVVSITDNGPLRSLSIYEMDDEDGAIAELDRRYSGVKARPTLRSSRRHFPKAGPSTGAIGKRFGAVSRRTWSCGTTNGA